METVSINGNGEKVYRFDEKQFAKVYIPKLILAFGILLIQLTLWTFVFHFVSNYLPGFVVLPVFYIIVFSYGFFRTRSLNYGSCVRIINLSTQQAVFDTYRVSNEAVFTVRRIDSMKRNRFYILIRGDIQSAIKYIKVDKEYTYGTRKRLRIPAYFENMDEIYSDLKRIQNQIELSNQN